MSEVRVAGTCSIDRRGFGADFFVGGEKSICRWIGALCAGGYLRTVLRWVINLARAHATDGQTPAVGGRRFSAAGTLGPFILVLSEFFGWGTS